MAARRCAAQFREQHPRYIHLLMLAVHPEQQGRGLGEAGQRAGVGGRGRAGCGGVGEAMQRAAVGGEAVLRAVVGVGG